MTTHEDRQRRLDELCEKRTQEYLQRLNRRADYLKVRIADTTKPPNGYAEAELQALLWSIDICEAAVLIGTIRELEGVAGMEDPPTPEEWAARGEVVQAPVVRTDCKWSTRPCEAPECATLGCGKQFRIDSGSRRVELLAAAQQVADIIPGRDMSTQPVEGRHGCEQDR